MPPVGFEPTVPASELPQTDALDRATTVTSIKNQVPTLIYQQLSTTIPDNTIINSKKKS